MFLRRVLVLSLCFLLAIAIISCSSKSSLPTYDDDVIIIDVPVYQELSTPLPSISQMFDTIDVVLETGGFESLIGDRISDIKICDDTLIILSNDALQLFDINGNFIRKIDRKGRGPGEYSRISHFDLDEKNHHVIILDDYSGLLRYTLGGKFVSKISYSNYVLDFALMPDGGYVFYNPFAKSPDGGLWTIDSQGNFIRTLLSLDEYDIHSISGNRWLTHINDSVIGFSGITVNFYHITGDTIIPTFHITSDLIDPEINPFPENGGLGAYYTDSYYESDGLFMFNLSFTSPPYHFTRTFYDKKNGQSSYLFARPYINTRVPADNRIPHFTSSYKECFFSVLSTSEILNHEQLKTQYPQITEDSNPVIRIFRSK